MPVCKVCKALGIKQLSIFYLAIDLELLHRTPQKARRTAAVNEPLGTEESQTPSLSPKGPSPQATGFEPVAASVLGALLL